MELRNLRLSLENICKVKNGSVLATGTSVQRVRNADGSYSREPAGYAVHCAAFRGDTLKVKLPLSVASKITALAKLLNDNTDVLISFNNLTFCAYAMQTGTGMISGVSAKADDFEIVSDDDELIEP